MGKRKGRGPNLTEKLAASLLQFEANLAVVMNREPAITWEASKRMSPRQIIAHFECDHYPIAAWVTDGIPCNKPWNLTWRLKAEHREKTNKVDTPAAAKSKRIRARREPMTILERVGPTDFIVKGCREGGLCTYPACGADCASTPARLRQRQPKPKSKYKRKLRGGTELRT
jgi:hypothetical protein